MHIEGHEHFDRRSDAATATLVRQSALLFELFGPQTVRMLLWGGGAQGARAWDVLIDTGDRRWDPPPAGPEALGETDRLE